jgi:S-(hydroxymethyl)glutathione dehydrogenase / alcohol dehydrogenase
VPTEVRAAVLHAPGEPLAIETLTLADPRPHEVRIGLHATGLCHSDLNYIQGHASHYLPVVLGHEGMGTVLEVGSAVTRVRSGDTVIPYLVPDCGTCEWCRSGLTNNCMTMNRDFDHLGYTPLSLGGAPVGNLLGTATFAEQTVVRETQVVKVSPDAEPAVACCLACGVTTGLGAALQTARVRPGSAVVVFGLGGVGLGAVQGSRIAGAATIVAIDTNPAREPVARKLGATHFVDGRSPMVVDEIREITGGGAAYGFECAGRPELYRPALNALNRGCGGVLVGVGVLPATASITLTSADLAGVTITRSFMGNAKASDVATYVDWYVNGKINLDDIVSHRLPLDEINKGFELATSGRAVRVVVVFN